MKRHFAWLIVVGLMLAACSSGVADDAAGTTVHSDVQLVENNELYIYLADSDKSALVEYCIEVDKSDLGLQITSVIRMLKSGAEDEGLKGTLPDNILVESIKLDGDNVILHVADGFGSMSQIDFLLCRISLIKSLTAIDGVESVEFYVDGTPMRDANGIVYGPFYSDDVVMDSMSDESSETRNMILYFPDEQGENLIRVDREVTMSSSESVEFRIIEELRTPPSEQGLGSVLPVEASVKSIEVSDGICYIDFNEAFKTKHYGGSTGETMTVYAIVNSLTELPNISHVQFMIEGKRVEDFKGHLDFSTLFENDINLISRDRRISD